MRESLGGQVRLIATGSAPITEEVVNFLKVVFSCPIVQGYGQTEGLGMQFATWSEDIYQDCIGGPFSQNEFKLVDVPELNYLSTNKDFNGNISPQGELWI
jgi:long-chain acyl-CoA synthetase